MSSRESGLQVLDREECLRLLASAPFGRIAFTVDGLPALEPVAFVLDEARAHIVIRTWHGSRFLAGSGNAVVAFEIDDYDAVSHTGWSVTAIGRATAASDPSLLRRLGRLPLRSWPREGMEHFLLIPVTVVHGRRIVPPQVAAGEPAIDAAGEPAVDTAFEAAGDGVGQPQQVGNQA